MVSRARSELDYVLRSLMVVGQIRFFFFLNKVFFLGSSQVFFTLRASRSIRIASRISFGLKHEKIGGRLISSDVAEGYLTRNRYSVRWGVLD